MRVLVTGGAGFIGSYTVRELLKAGETAIAYDLQIAHNSLDAVLGEAEVKKLIVVKGNITDIDCLNQSIRQYQIDAIAHLASPLSPQTEGNPGLAIQNMIKAQQVVLEAARQANLRKVVWASSVSVYGPAGRYPVSPLPNDATHDPLTLYGACKSFNEYLARHYTNQFGLETIGLRFPLVYGVGRQRGAAMFLNDLIEKPATGQPCRLPTGDGVYNWLYVEDAATAVLQSLRSNKTVARAFNIGGEVATVRQAAEIVLHWFPEATIDLEPGEYGVAAKYDCTPLKNEVGFSPRWPLHEGLRASVNIVRQRAGLLSVG